MKGTLIRTVKFNDPDVSVSGNTVSITISNYIKPGISVTGLSYDLKSGFGGGPGQTYTEIRIGIDSNNNAGIFGDIIVAGGPTGMGSFDMNEGPFSFSNYTDVVISFNIDGTGNLSDMTTGEIDFYLQQVNALTGVTQAYMDAVAFDGTFSSAILNVPSGYDCVLGITFKKTSGTTTEYPVCGSWSFDPLDSTQLTLECIGTGGILENTYEIYVILSNK